jgi:hypothetical protein
MRRARLSCALLRQAMMPLSPGLVLVRLLPLFPVRKSFGEPEHAVMPERGARPRPQCGTEGLALGG